MTNPAITEVKELAKLYESSGAILILTDLDENRVVATSYGHTKKHCNDLRKIVDRIITAFSSGDYEI